MSRAAEAASPGSVKQSCQLYCLKTSAIYFREVPLELLHGVFCISEKASRGTNHQFFGASKYVSIYTVGTSDTAY